MEEETGKVVSMSCWAEAAKHMEKVLKQHLHYGWCCRDELLRSTISLVLYFARNYRDLGIALEYLIQAGSIGVLQGAERFDHTRGYKFATYIQYWIRKSILRMVARHARGIQVPCALSRAIGQIQKARKALSKSHAKYPEEEEIAKMTCVSLSKIRSADKCFRVVGSIDRKIGDFINAKLFGIYPRYVNREAGENCDEAAHEGRYACSFEWFGKKREASGGSTLRAQWLSPEVTGTLRAQWLSPEVTGGDRKAFLCEQRVDKKD